MVKSKDTTQDSKIAYKILIEPWITEESTRQAELNKYVFRVSERADKKQIERSIEGVYSVKVVSVNTISIPKKPRYRGNKLGWKSGYKKAIVTVKEGDKIDIFEK